MSSGGASVAVGNFCLEREKLESRGVKPLPHFKRVCKHVRVCHVRVKGSCKERKKKEKKKRGGGGGYNQARGRVQPSQRAAEGGEEGNYRRGEKPGGLRLNVRQGAAEGGGEGSYRRQKGTRAAYV